MIPCPPRLTGGELLKKEVLYVYENDIAKGMCKLVPQQYRNSHVIYLGGVAIHPLFSGKGEGLKMLGTIKEFAEENNLNIFSIQNFWWLAK